jgi:hypothetical protein
MAGGSNPEQPLVNAMCRKRKNPKAATQGLLENNTLKIGTTDEGYHNNRIFQTHQTSC